MEHCSLHYVCITIRRVEPDQRFRVLEIGIGWIHTLLRQYIMQSL